MESLQIIQSLDVAGAVTTLAEYQDRLAKATAAQAELLKKPYSLETKAAYDGFRDATKSRSKELEGKRKPITLEFDKIKTLFTTTEKAFLSLNDPLDLAEREWKQAQLTKQREEEAELQKAATRTRVLAEFIPKVEALLVDLVYDTKTAYLEALIAGTDPLPFQITNDTWSGLCKRAMAQIGGQDFGHDLAAAIAPRKEALMLSTTKDIHEWQASTIKSKGNIKALQAIARTMGLAYTEAVADAVQNAETAKVEAEMEIAETAQIAQPEVVIGTKFIPKPANLKEVQEIFRHWLVEAAPSVDEAFALIGKAATMCKREALKGNKWVGVTYIEDVK